jgi:hypothetical protein
MATADLDNQTRLFIQVWFDMGNFNDRPEFKTSLGNSSTDYRERLRTGIAEIINKQLLTFEEFLELTFGGGVDVTSEHEVYQQLKEMYEFLFDEPVAKVDVDQKSCEFCLSDNPALSLSDAAQEIGDRIGFACTTACLNNEKVFHIVNPVP